MSQNKSANLCSVQNVANFQRNLKVVVAADKFIATTALIKCLGKVRNAKNAKIPSQNES